MLVRRVLGSRRQWRFLAFGWVTLVLIVGGTAAQPARGNAPEAAVGNTPAQIDVQAAATAVPPNPEGMKVAEELAAKLRAAGIACDRCEEGTAGFVDPKIREQLPAPRAVVSCTAAAEEDITFNVFADAEEARRFVTGKQAYLCRQTYKHKVLNYPGFVYVTGGPWVIEPDERETARRIAATLGGEAAVADCSALWPTPTRVPPSNRDGAGS